MKTSQIEKLREEIKFLKIDLERQNKNVENIQESMCLMRLPFSKDKFVRVSKKHKEDIGKLFNEFSTLICEIEELKSKVSMMDFVIRTAKEVILKKNAKWIDAKIIELLKEGVGVKIWLK